MLNARDVSLTVIKPRYGVIEKLYTLKQFWGAWANAGLADILFEHVLLTEVAG
jgi:hypothetical protein